MGKLGESVITTNMFSENLKDGNICEERVKKKFLPFFYTYINRVIYDNKENQNIQKKGIDGNIIYNQTPYEVKCRDYKYYDKNPIKHKILLETVSSVEYKQLGWLFTTNSDITIYLWQNQTKTKFVEGYILHMNEIRRWLASKVSDFPIAPIDKLKGYNYVIEKGILTELYLYFKYISANSNNYEWTTDSILISAIQFPIKCLELINVDTIHTQFTELSNLFEQE